jgi:hypothetical protein
MRALFEAVLELRRDLLERNAGKVTTSSRAEMLPG